MWPINGIKFFSEKVKVIAFWPDFWPKNGKNGKKCHTCPAAPGLLSPILPQNQGGARKWVFALKNEHFFFGAILPGFFGFFLKFLQIFSKFLTQKIED